MKIFQIHAKQKTDAQIEHDALLDPNSVDSLERAVRMWKSDQDGTEVVELEKGAELRLTRRIPAQETAMELRRIRNALRRFRQP